MSSIKPPRPFAVLPRGLAPLGYRNYLLYWIGISTSNTGRWLELTGALWLVYELTDSPLLLGILGVARALPGIILSPVAGVLADRVDQRRLLIATQAMSLVVSLSLGLLVLGGGIMAWHVYVGVALQSALSCFDAAGRQTIFPKFVPRTQLPSAVTLGVTAARFAKFLGPMAGGFAIAGLGEAAPFLINSASFLVLLPAITLIRGFVPSAPHAPPAFLRDLTEGLRHIFSAPVLRGLFIQEFVFGLLELNAVIIAVIARVQLGAGAEAMGLLLAAPALGSFAGIMWLTFVGHSKRQGRFSLISLFVYGLLLIGVALSHTYLLTFGVLALIGLLDAFNTITRNSIVQLAAPPHMRGRVMSSMGIVTRGVSPLAETQSGVVADLAGPTVAVLAAAGVLITLVTLSATLNRALWNFTFVDE